MDAAPPLPELESMAGACGEELLELGDLPRELLLRVMEHLPAAAVVSVPRPCTRLPYRPKPAADESAQRVCSWGGRRSSSVSCR